MSPIDTTTLRTYDNDEADEVARLNQDVLRHDKTQLARLAARMLSQHPQADRLEVLDGGCEEDLTCVHAVLDDHEDADECAQVYNTMALEDFADHEVNTTPGHWVLDPTTIREWIAEENREG